MNRQLFEELKRQAASPKREVTYTTAQAAWHEYFEAEMLIGTRLSRLTRKGLAAMGERLAATYGRYEPLT